MKKPIHLMTKYILSFLFSLITIFSFAQEKVTITGKVTDVLNFPLTDSEVILGNKADSAQISTTSTNDDGTFKSTGKTASHIENSQILSKIESSAKRSFLTVQEEHTEKTELVEPENEDD